MYASWDQEKVIEKLESQLTTLLRPARVCEPLTAAIPSTCAATDSLEARIKKAQAAVDNASSARYAAERTLDALRSKQKKV